MKEVFLIGTYSKLKNNNQIIINPINKNIESELVSNKSGVSHNSAKKNVEKLNIWDAYEQACVNSGDYEPIVVMKKNGKKPLVVVDAEYYIKLHSQQG